MRNRPGKKLELSKEALRTLSSAELIAFGGEGKPADPPRASESPPKSCGYFCRPR